jgi:hypothetical protein
VSIVRQTTDVGLPLLAFSPYSPALYGPFIEDEDPEFLDAFEGEVIGQQGIATGGKSGGDLESVGEA